MSAKLGREWKVVFAADEKRHVIPLNDINGHSLTRRCPCLPEFCPGTAGSVVTHNSYDGREINEAGFWGDYLTVN